MNSLPCPPPLAACPPRCGHRGLITALALLWGAAAHAQAEGVGSAVPQIGLSAALQTFAVLVLILAAFIGLAWLLRRASGGHGSAGGGPMRIVGGLSLGSRERIVLVEVEDTWLVVGIAPGQVRTLHAMPRSASPTGPNAGPPFAHWLRRFRERTENAGE